MPIQILTSVLAIILPITIAYINKSAEVKRLRNEKLLLQHSRDRWENYYKDYIWRLEARIDRLAKENLMAQRCRKNTIKAVKYAMIRAHPDNGGKEEDFIMFWEVYKELTKK